MLKKKKNRKPLDPRCYIYLQAKDIAKLRNVDITVIYKQLNNTDNVWENFWLLVEYLESKGLRPR